MAGVLASLAGEVRMAALSDKVFKDECVFSFQTPESEGGLYVCLSTFLGFSRPFAELHTRKTKHALFLHITTTKTAVELSEEEKALEKPSEMAIGGPGGFDVGGPKFEYHHEYEIVVLPGGEAFPVDAELPTQILLSAQSIIEADTSTKADQITEWKEELAVSKFAEGLEQLDNGVKIPPSGFKCSQCDITDNLWLNLTDGTILCGRKFWDGSGGNNHAVEHFEKTQCPLCVKLGTITADGADVYSYAEDSMVLDPNLTQHLLHFGIDVNEMKKTASTMAEMEIEANMSLSVQMDTITEKGHALVSVYGPGYTGLKNLGNTCYLASIMQVVFSLPEFQETFFKRAPEFFERAPSQPQEHFVTQMAKLATGLLSGDHSKAPAAGEDADSNSSIQPRMFKTLIGKGHPEFCTNAQQDALQFFEHLLEKLERGSHGTDVRDCSILFKYKIEDKLVDGQSKQVRYSERLDNCLKVPVDLALATNKAEADAYKAKIEADPTCKDDPVRYNIPFEAALTQVFGPETIEFKSPVTNKSGFAQTMFRFKTFPRYLVVSISKFGLTDAWVPYKKDVSITPPDELDLTAYGARGILPGEVPLPESKPEAAAAVEIDEGMVAQLVGMGFAHEGCRRAVFHNPTSVEAAMEWVFAHMGDADFATPFVVPGSEAAAAPSSGPTDEQIAPLTQMGFTADQARKALKKTDNNVERAADWIFSHIDELSTMEEEEDDSVPSMDALPSESGRYRLKAFVTHGGRSTGSGHYICHIRKEGKWVIFNDRKAALSVATPLDLGYLYFYESLP